MADQKTRTRPRPGPSGSDSRGERRPWRVEGERAGDAAAKGDDAHRGGMPRPPGSRRFWRFLLVLLVLNIVLAPLIPSSEDKRLDVPYTFFRQQVTAGNVKQVNARNDVIQGTFRREVKFEKKGPETRFETVRPTFAQDDELLKLLLDERVEVNARPIDTGRGFWATLLLSFGPFLLILGLLFYFFRRSAAAAGGGALALGRSKAKRYEATAHRTTFEDVAGIEEAEAELVEIVDFLKNPSKYTRLAPTPTTISMNSDAESEKNGTSASPATARASSVLPVPGGPLSRTPLGIAAPRRRYLSGFLRKSTISTSSSSTSSMPATSVNETRVRVAS